MWKVRIFCITLIESNIQSCNKMTIMSINLFNVSQLAEFPIKPASYSFKRFKSCRKQRKTLRSQKSWREFCFGFTIKTRKETLKLHQLPRYPQSPSASPYLHSTGCGLITALRFHLWPKNFLFYSDNENYGAIYMKE